jgi:hypothetical protein
MELGKYIRAMRPKKYLTREFKVYDASMADDNTIDTNEHGCSSYG